MYRKMKDPNMTHTRPTTKPHLVQNNPQRRQAYDPYAKCHAFRHTDHRAVQCDTLAMAILIRKYMGESLNADAMKKALENWFQRHAEALKCPQNKEASNAKPYRCCTPTWTGT